MTLVDDRPTVTFGALAVGEGFQIPTDPRMFMKVADAASGGTANFIDFGVPATPNSLVNHLDDATVVVKVNLSVHIS